MDIRSQISADDERKLLWKMSIEYQAADNYTRSWKSEYANVKDEYLNPKANEDRVKVKMILNLMKMKRSIFKSDDETVTNVPQNGANGAEQAENTNKVFQSVFRTAQIRMKKGKAMDDDTLTGIWCLAVDGYNNHRQEPIVSYIDSRLTFPDPSNSEGSCMRFFWTLLQKTIYELEWDDAYDSIRVNEVKAERNEEIQKVNRDNGNQEWDVGDDLVSIYNHITIFKKSDDDQYYKYLTTWNASRSKLLRIVKMMPLNEDEKADPSKITLWVTLYRWVPIPGQYNGASAVDEVWPYQDLITLMTNLQVAQALRNVVWGKTIIDWELGIDENDYASMDSGEVIIANRTQWSQVNVSNGIWKEWPEPVSQSVDNTIASLNRFAQEATLQNSIQQGQSFSGSQTKSEIQTIQANTNTVLSGVAEEYMESSINLWTDIYRSFQTNMSSQRIKELTLVWDNGDAKSYGMKKGEFISKWDIYITIKSKAQEDIKNKQDYAIMLSLDASMSGFLQNDATWLGRWKRTMLNKSWVKGLNGEDYVKLSPDERAAKDNLSLLNMDIMLESKPQPWEDHEVYIATYKNWVPTKARDKAIKAREKILLVTPKKTEQPQEVKGSGGGGLGASMIASDFASNGGDESLANIKQ